MGEILTGVTEDDPFAPVHEKRIATLKSPGFFLDGPGGTGKTVFMRIIQCLLTLRSRKVISVATSAVAASLVDNGRRAVPYSRYQFRAILIMHAVYPLTLR